MTTLVKTLRTIYAAAREKGVSNEELHDTISVGFGKTSLKELTYEEVGQLLDGLRGGGSRHISLGRRQAMGNDGRKDAQRSRTQYLINPSEIALLRSAAALRGWSESTLTDFCRRQVQKDRPVTMAEFNKVFWALKSMNKRDGLFTGSHQ